jgi:hypothetical protein
MFFVSDRAAGSLGLLDIWVSTRRSVHEPWATPENLACPPLNTEFNEQRPDLSRDGRTLLFDSDRPGGFGATDIWISTRTPSGQ